MKYFEVLKLRKKVNTITYIIYFCFRAPTVKVLRFKVQKNDKKHFKICKPHSATIFLFLYCDVYIFLIIKKR